MAGKVLNTRDCSTLKLRSGLTGKYHAIPVCGRQVPLLIQFTVGGNAKKTSQYSKKPLNNFRFTLEFEFSFVG
jgi:hypothetical protein